MVGRQEGVIFAPWGFAAMLPGALGHSSVPLTLSEVRTHLTLCFSFLVALGGFVSYSPCTCTSRQQVKEAGIIPHKWNKWNKKARTTVAACWPQCNNPRPAPPPRHPAGGAQPSLLTWDRYGSHLSSPGRWAPCFQLGQWVKLEQLGQVLEAPPESRALLSTHLRSFPVSPPPRQGAFCVLNIYQTWAKQTQNVHELTDLWSPDKWALSSLRYDAGCFTGMIYSRLRENI